MDENYAIAMSGSDNILSCHVTLDDARREKSMVEEISGGRVVIYRFDYVINGWVSIG